MTRRRPLYLLLLLLLLLLHVLPATVMAATAVDPVYTATDSILLSCGTSSNSNDTAGRSWVGDERSSYAPPNASAISSASSASLTDRYASPVPYQKARIFHSHFTYTFPVSPGPKFLRLYFYPAVYSELDASQSSFSATANRFTLFTNFTASPRSRPLTQPSFTKEYLIYIEQTQPLVLTFAPKAGSFAFINGIEIVSMPAALYFGRYDVLNGTALENLYRLNVGGPYVDIRDDSGMFRAWSPDNEFILDGDFGHSYDNQGLRIKYTIQTPSYSAPTTLYTSARIATDESTSLEWGFPVDSGFVYLLRLHFCEIQLGVTKQKQRVFTVFINDGTAETDADVISWSGGDGIPVFRDYLTRVSDDGRPGKPYLRLSLKPHTESASALLNGLEIFKLSDPHGSTLAVMNSSPLENPSPLESPSPLENPSPENKSRRSKIYAVIGCLIGVVAAFAAASFLILRRWRRRRRKKKGLASWTTTVTKTSRASLSTTTRSDSCRYFTIGEIRAATLNFDNNGVIGRGGFGHVYRGIIEDGGAAVVAVKRLNPSSSQGAREFLTEIEMLSKLRHLHLVSLIGCCDEEGEMILVYDYMARGSLRDHLYNTDNPPLTWIQRLRICSGAAKGLNYLHTGTEHSVIHRDVKPTNILLDEEWTAKISDFGLSKMGEANDSFTHISTNVKGTFGYLDPKYLSTHQLTRKSDVYAFGVVLFEVLSGRPAVDVELDEEQHSLAGWARVCVREGEVDRLVDPKLAGQISGACLQVFVGMGARSIHIQPLERPTMADVVMGLDLAMALQETTCPVKEADEDMNEMQVVLMEDGIVNDSRGEVDGIIIT